MRFVILSLCKRRKIQRLENTFTIFGYFATLSMTRLRVFNGLKRLSFQVFMSKIYTRHQRLFKKAKIQQNAFCPKNLQIKDKFKI